MKESDLECVATCIELIGLATMIVKVDSPIEEAAKVALSTVMDRVPHLEVVESIRFVLFGERDFRAFKEALRSLTEL